MKEIELTDGRKVTLKPVTLRAIIEAEKVESTTEKMAVMIAACTGLGFDEVLDLPFADIEQLQKVLDSGASKKK